MDAAELFLISVDFKTYCQYVHRGAWVPAAHHNLICERLQDVIEGRINRLIIEMPPRHGKSMTVTKTFPSFFLGRFPDKRVIEASYGADLAQEFGLSNRRKLEEFGKEIFGVEIAADNKSKTDWGINNREGGMLSAGIGGTITGKGADLMLIDDPIKNQQEADSETYRNRTWGEWQSTLRTRLHAGAAVIIILTRWHEDDLVGRLLNPEYGDPDEWVILRLPAICEDDNDLVGRAVGDPLWPEGGYDKEWMERTERAVGSRTWSALYQQRPSPAEGSILKRHWWQYYDHRPDRFDEVLQSWDCAFKGTTTSDFVAGQVWGRIGADKYLLDQIHARLDMPGTMLAFRNMFKKWPKSSRILVEDKANGSAVIQMMKHEISGLIPVNPEGGKEARAYAASAEIESGNVYLPTPALCPWVNDFVEECTAFPNGKHDDQVDACTQALIYFKNRKQTGIYFL